MKLITDLHIHSHFSLATSKQLAPEFLDIWGKMKGLQVIATGDFTHPGWTKELMEKLVPAEPGLFKLKDNYQVKTPIQRFNSGDLLTRFILSAEISSIYKKNGKVRKVHNVVLAPNFETVEKIQQKLVNIGGNITSDGRPILGLDSRDLLEICLEASPDIFFIPAHIWTPWFSALGAKSGFDSIEECYGDLTENIYAVETGLSTNAPMNWMCSFLDKYVLLSNSDAHSPEKLGRNANIMDCELSYNGIINSMKIDNGANRFLGTIDMYPQEGKYHYDGHRKCNVVYDPVETLEHNGLCEKCGRKITVGVMNRIVELSDRNDLTERPDRKPYHSIIPLKELLSEISGVGPNTKTVKQYYNKILTDLGSELDILLNIPVDEIQSKAGSLLTEAIDRMRRNRVIIQEGFDGQYGVIRVFDDNELKQDRNAPKLFPEAIKEPQIEYHSDTLLNFSLERYHQLLNEKKGVSEPIEGNNYATGLNSEQIAAVEMTKKSCLVLAGPGTGKTKTLVNKIEYLIKTVNLRPKNVLAITFTNKAADEIRVRIKQTDKKSRVNVMTFHKLGLQIITENATRLGLNNPVTIINQQEKEYLLKNRLAVKKESLKKISTKLSIYKQNKCELDEWEREIFEEYQNFLSSRKLVDIDDLVYLSVKLLSENIELCREYQQKFKYILIDEYQDINEIQFQLVKLLYSENHLFAIGDTNQAIYGFRGADVKFIQQFSNHFPGSEIINFSKSYRCSNQILAASDDVIQNQNPLTGLQKGVRIRIHQAETEKSEAEFIARKIEEIAGGFRFFSMDSDVTDGYDDTDLSGLDDIIVLCRTRMIIPPIVKAFHDHAIPCEIIDNKPFWEEKPIREIINIYKTLLNPDYNQLLDLQISSEEIKQLQLEESSRATLEKIIHHHFSGEIKSHRSDIQRLLDFADNFPNHSELLEKLSLRFTEDYSSQKAHNVKIMTMHASKGLEFTHVFIAGCENKLVPFGLYKNMAGDFDEEKRLFYVAMTRSKKYLYLTHVKTRTIRGVRYALSPSPYLEKIKRELLKVEKNTYKKQPGGNNQLELF